MKTELITHEHLDEAVALLSQGKIVAFPTETVYGLGAKATDEQAVQRVFEVKGRPSDNPLIVHVARKDISEYVEELPSYFFDLVDRFWPGPLTVVLKAKPGIFAKSVSAGLDTVSFRMPNNPETLALIEQLGTPIVGPSANTSGKPSPTRAAHVLDDFFGKIEGVLYGENAAVGIESTVVDLTDPDKMTILRPGAITEFDLSDFPIESYEEKVLSDSDVPMAPGMKYRHYAPQQPIYLMDSQDPELWDLAIGQLKKENKKIGMMADENFIDCYGLDVDNTYSLGGIEDIAEASKRLYEALRYFDKTDVDVILAQAYEKRGMGVALMNRLEKAAGNHYFKKDE